MTDAQIYMAIGLGFLAGASGAHYLWRRQLRAPVVVLALALAALAATLFEIGRAKTGFMNGFRQIFWALGLTAGPVAGLAFGALIGWLRGPAPAHWGIS